MGLDTSHGCWHGAYGAFMTWRTKLAEVAGLPPLELMEGFYTPLDSPGGLPTLYHGSGVGVVSSGLQRLDALLPIDWDCLKPDALHFLLSHSDCEGEIPAWRCAAIADRLEELLPLLPLDPHPGHIGDWREKTQTFIDGLRLASRLGDAVNFH